jgi:mRNA interferase MazF
MNAIQPLRGDVWDANFNPTIGREQAGIRPALVVSVNGFNEGPAELVVVVPLTRTERRIRWHVRIAPPEGGLTAESFLQCENVRAISKARLKRRRGRVSHETLQQIEDRLRILLGL